MSKDGFFNPKSMLTPGIAGLAITGIGNSLWDKFPLLREEIFYIILGLSFLIVVPIVINYQAKYWEKGIYIIFNTLLVFSISCGSNSIGNNIEKSIYHNKFNKNSNYVTPPNLSSNSRIQSDSSYANSPNLSQESRTPINSSVENNENIHKCKDKMLFPSWFKCSC